MAVTTPYEHPVNADIIDTGVESKNPGAAAATVEDALEAARTGSPGPRPHRPVG